jgi:hypothetical protein
MVRLPAQPVLWLLVFVQSIGLCRCLVAQAAGPEYVVATRLADGITGGQDHHEDRPGEQIACDTKVSVKADNDQSNLFVVLLTPALVDILPPTPFLPALSADSAVAPALPHESRSLPLLI